MRLPFGRVLLPALLRSHGPAHLGPNSGLLHADQPENSRGPAAQNLDLQIVAILSKKSARSLDGRINILAFEIPKILHMHSLERPVIPAVSPLPYERSLLTGRQCGHKGGHPNSSARHLYRTGPGLVDVPVRLCGSSSTAVRWTECCSPSSRPPTRTGSSGR